MLNPLESENGSALSLTVSDCRGVLRLNGCCRPTSGELSPSSSSPCAPSSRLKSPFPTVRKRLHARITPFHSKIPGNVHVRPAIHRSRSSVGSSETIRARIERICAAETTWSDARSETQRSDFALVRSRPSFARLCPPETCCFVALPYEAETRTYLLSTHQSRLSKKPFRTCPLTIRQQLVFSSSRFLLIPLVPIRRGACSSATVNVSRVTPVPEADPIDFADPKKLQVHSCLMKIHTLNLTLARLHRYVFQANATVTNVKECSDHYYHLCVFRIYPSNRVTGRSDRGSAECPLWLPEQPSSLWR